MAEPIKVLKGKRWPWDWRPDTLAIYDDRMIYQNRGWIASNESTIPYSQVSQVNMHSGLMRCTLELINTGGAENIVLQNLAKNEAREAQGLIEQRMMARG